MPTLIVGKYEYGDYMQVSKPGLLSRHAGIAPLKHIELRGVAIPSGMDLPAKD